MIYLDSSAVLKLLHDEPESADLERWVGERPGKPLVSSELVKVEVLRACRRMNADSLPEARALLGGLDLIPLSGVVLDHAAEVGDSGISSLDAIHLASALSIRGDLSAFVVYDPRLLEAAAAAGLQPVSPGSDRPQPVSPETDRRPGRLSRPR